jgi:hypothetical protein
MNLGRSNTASTPLCWSVLLGRPYRYAVPLLCQAEALLGPFTVRSRYPRGIDSNMKVHRIAVWGVVPRPLLLLLIRTSDRPRVQAQTSDMLGVAPSAHVCTPQRLEPAQALTITLMYIL